MVTKIMRAIASIPRNMVTEYGNEEVVEDFEAVGFGGEYRTDQMERFLEGKNGQLDRFGTWLKLKYEIEVYNFLGTLNLEDLIDWIGELED